MSNPNFPVVTLSVWYDQQSDDLLMQVHNKIAELVLENKTDNMPEIIREPYPEIYVRRNWVDTSAANNWITFVQGLGGALSSITIQS
jgi:hypothetical protein